MKLPGVPREAIDITYDHSELTVSGERRDLSDEDGLTFWRRERYYGTFRRSMTLPADVDGSQISARHQDGLLMITVREGCAAPPTIPHRVRIEDQPA